MAAEGWVKIYRMIQENWIWEDKPFSRGQAFIDLLLMVNHQDSKVPFNGSVIEVKRGEKITSLRKLSERWGWSNKKVKKFLDELKNEQMISYKSDTKKTVVSIDNYSVYQNKENEKETPKKQQGNTEAYQKHIKSISKAYQKHTNKNEKNIKNDKECKEGKEGEEEISILPPLSFPTPIHESIFNQFGEIAYRTWFEPSELIIDDNTLTIKAPNAFSKDHIENKYKKSLEILFKKKVEVRM